MSQLFQGKLATDGALTTSYNINNWVGPDYLYEKGSEASEPGISYIGPFVPKIVRPFEISMGIVVNFPVAVSWSSDKDWVFFSDNATAAATRRIVLMEFSRSAKTLTPKGFITLTYPIATVHTIRGLQVAYDKHTIGTVAVSGTAVTGTSTQFSTDRVPVGCRIGFGSTDASAITTWYEISAVGSDSSITLSSSAGTISAGTSYVIEDLRIITANTNATATNGGLFLTKGIQYANFTIGGTTIPAAVSTDNIRAVYWLKDAATVINTASAGAALAPKIDFQTQYVYLNDVNTRIYKYNIRAALTLASGADTTAITAATATQTLTGTLSQNNALVFETVSHGPGSGVPSLYFVTTTRVYRVPEANVTAGGAYLSGSDVMTEVPPGGAVTHAATGALSSIAYDSVTDRFLITSSGATAFRHYMTRYRVDAGQMDHIFGADFKQLNQAGADSGIVNTFSGNSTNINTFVLNGIAYIVVIGTTVTTNFIHVLPTGVHWDYAFTASTRLISPKILTPNNSNFVRAFVNTKQFLGSANLGLSPDACRVYYRTSGIDDNSGSWTLLNQRGDLSGVAAAAAIQFAFTFKMMSPIILPAQVLSVGVVYEDFNTLSNYLPMATFTDETPPKFAWKFATAYGGTVPDLRIRLYDANTNGLLLDDNTASPTGTFERSTAGVTPTWVAWTNTDRVNDTDFLRYTPASLGSGIQVRALLTLN
jgi:hypothetical protein